jgi:AmiR/NasT family two-component response regulator
MAENPPSDRSVARYSDEQVDGIIGSRAIIEQAKGVLMHVYGVNAAHAFKMLRSRSRANRVKLHLLAKLLLDDPAAAKDLWG